MKQTCTWYLEYGTAIQEQYFFFVRRKQKPGTTIGLVLAPSNPREMLAVNLTYSVYTMGKLLQKIMSLPDLYMSGTRPAELNNVHPRIFSVRRWSNQNNENCYISSQIIWFIFPTNLDSWVFIGSRNGIFLYIHLFCFSYSRVSDSHTIIRYLRIIHL